MATMKGSGVYVTEVDESFQSFDTTNLKFMVPMFTKKGEVGKLNAVTIADFKDKVGYDLSSSYASGYLGLQAILGAASQVEVFRINKNAKYGNVVLFRDGTFYQTDNVADLDALEAAACLRESDAFTVGAGPAGSGSLAETVKTGTLKLYLGAVEIANDSALPGTMAFLPGYTTGTPACVYTPSTGVFTITFPTGTVVSTLYHFTYTHDSSIAAVVAMKTPGDWDTLSVRFSRYRELVENFVSSGTLAFSLGTPVEAVTDAYKLYNLAGDLLASSDAPNAGSATITGTGITGSVTLATGAVTLTFNPVNYPPAGFPMLLHHKYIQDDPYFLCEVLKRVTIDSSTSYSTLEEQKVSFVETLDYFLDTVVFSNLYTKTISTLDVSPAPDSTPLAILYGDDGDQPDAADLSFVGVDPTRFSMICANGLIGASLVSKFVEFGVQYSKLVLWDIPNVTTALAAKAYADSVIAAKESVCYWVSDFVTVDNKEYCVYPSVKAALAYANMFKKTGYLNYPPAGYEFAAVSAESLLATDASINGAYLKQNKINYIAQKSAGPVIWEHRTRYAFESDLSYASTVMSYFALSSRMKAYADNFPFRFVTPELLITLKAGLESIAQDYLQRGFVWLCEVQVPSFADVKASGARFMDINVNVKFAEDGQEFTFNFHIKATA